MRGGRLEANAPKFGSICWPAGLNWAVVGLTYKILPAMTFYTGYSESNRAPTPLELGCSNPAKPCLLEGFLVSDPPLQQVVARTKEIGLRGDSQIAGGRYERMIQYARGISRGVFT